MCSIVPVDTCSDCPWEKFHSFLSQDHLESKIKLCMFHYSHAIRILHKRKTSVVWVCWASRDRGHNKTDAGGTPTPYQPLNCLKEVQCCLKCLLRAITIILIQLLYALFFLHCTFPVGQKTQHGDYFLYSGARWWARRNPSEYSRYLNSFFMIIFPLSQKEKKNPSHFEFDQRSFIILLKFTLNIKINELNWGGGSS